MYSDPRALGFDSIAPFRANVSDQVHQRQVDAWRRAFLTSTEDEVRRMLGEWVSELEPVLVFAAGLIFPMGLTAKGHCEIYVPSKWIRHHV